jgi:hypothetical protein
MGLLIFNVITAAVLVMELMGPLGVKYAVHRAGEANYDQNAAKNSDTEITSEDSVLTGDEII